MTTVTDRPVGHEGAQVDVTEKPRGLEVAVLQASPPLR